jgi:TolB-like protein
MSLFSELKRRNVFRVAVAYIVAAWLLVQVLELATESFGAPDWVMKTLITLAVVGILPVLIFSWVYELTPEGIRKESDIRPAESITAHTSRKLDIAVIVLLFGVMAMMALQRFSADESAVAQPPAVASSVAGQPATEVMEKDAIETEVAIAVLPFRDMSAEGDQGYFGEGIAEELLNALVKVDGLRVASRTSSFSYQGKSVNLPTIARELDVSHVLEGSIRSAGNRVRVTAQLIDVSRDAHLWSETFDRTLDDIFAIQDEITEQVLQALVVHLGDAAGSGSSAETLTDNPEAYQLYLKGRHLWRQRNPESLRAAVDLFNQTVDLDPLFARAWSNLAIAYKNLPSYDLSVDRESSEARGYAAAERALEIDPDLAEALVVRASASRIACDWIIAEQAFRQAIEADPKDPTARHWYALFLNMAGRAEASAEQSEAAYQLDPLNAAIASTVGDSHFVAGDLQSAARYWDDAAALGLDDGSRWAVGFLLALDGDIERGREIMMAEPLPQLPQFDQRPITEALLAALVDRDAIPDLERRVMALYDSGDLDIAHAQMFLAAVDSQRYFDLDVTPCRGSMPWAWMPGATEIRGDPRFFDHYESSGLVGYWREFGWPSQCDQLDPARAECDQ